MTYAVRTSTGTLKAKLSNISANTIINGTKGEFFKDSNGLTRYRIKEISVYTIGFRDSNIDLYLWEDDVLIPISD